MLVIDNYLLECGGSACRCGLLLFFVLCASVGAPLSYWVGFELLVRSGCIGISSRRAEWYTRWTKKMASSATVHMAAFEEGLGRIMFVAGALEHERQFLGPLCKFSSMHPRNAARMIPSCVSFILQYLSSEIAKKRHHPCGTRVRAAECTPRVDAQASAGWTGIEGWFPARRLRLLRWCREHRARLHDAAVRGIAGACAMSSSTSDGAGVIFSVAGVGAMCVPVHPFSRSNRVRMS